MKGIPMKSISLNVLGLVIKSLRAPIKVRAKSKFEVCEELADTTERTCNRWNLED